MYNLLTFCEFCATILTNYHTLQINLRGNPMKIKTKKSTYRQVIDAHNAKKHTHIKPKKPSIFFRTLMKLVSLPDMIATKFSFEEIGMDKLEKGEPAFYFMNHSSFIDLEIAATVMYPKPFNIVATTDAFFGKDWLMRQIGCIPTKKFCTDTTLVRDILHTVKKLRSKMGEKGDYIKTIWGMGYKFEP